jgi:hypothetical protein
LLIKGVCLCDSLLSLLVLTLFSPVYALECFVLSGIRQDYTNALGGPLRTRIEQQTVEVAGHSCKVFGDWYSLSQYIFPDVLNHPMKLDSTIPDGEKILIIQYAHGGPGGSASCDNLSTPGEEILFNLIHMAQRHRVGAFFNSCWSGDLIKAKIVAERKGLSAKEASKIVRSKKSIENLCMITGSGFGRMAAGGETERVLSAQKDENLNDFFLSLDRGLISSAQWEQSGVAEYMTGANKSQSISNVLDSLKTQQVQHLARVARNPLLASDRVSVEDASNVSSLLDAQLNSRSPQNQFSMQQESAEEDSASSDCMDAWKQHLDVSEDPNHSSYLAVGGRLYSFLRSPQVRSCRDDLTIEDEQVQMDDRVASLFLKDFSSEERKKIQRVLVGRATVDRIMGGGQEPAEVRDIDELAGYLGKFNEYLASQPSSSKRRPVQEKKKDLLNQTLALGPYSNMGTPATDQDWALMEFARDSLKRKYTNPIDIQRFNACEQFTFR